VDGLVRSGVVDYFVVSVALVGFSWIGMARLVRGQILYLKETQHVEAARAIGASTRRILFVHLLPNAISPVVVTVSMGMGSMVGTEIILSWLGLGIQPPRPSLGTMLLQGGRLTVLQEQPWLLLAPGLAAWVMVLAWNLLGDALNDVLNPRTR
jgi:peptide/nickel transport system permease protein